MDIRLIWQHVKHFKGVTDFTLNANGKNVSVIGDNGTGKTTQFDADQWIKFGKDSTDRSQFKVKPQDADGNDIHYLQTEVEQELLIDGRSLKIKKMQEEKWTKKNGSDSLSLTGNTISYWWDEVPVKEGEYSQKIKELIDENIFRMITNPMYFNTKVSWQDRRKILLEICGDMSDAEVIASDSKLSRLTAILSGRSRDDYRKIINERIGKLQDEKKDIRPRIDELSLTIPQVAPDYSSIENELREYQDQLAGVEREMTNASGIADAFKKKQQKLYGLKNKLDTQKSLIEESCNSGRKELIGEKSRLGNEKYQLDSDLKTFTLRIDQNIKAIENNSVERQKLRDEWDELSKTKAKYQSSEFVEPGDNDFCCPMCGAGISKSAKENKLAEMRMKFEADKAKEIEYIDRKLAQNRQSGISLKQSAEALQEANEAYRTKISQAELRVHEIENRLADIGIVLDEPTTVPDFSNDVEYVSLQQQIRDLEAELAKPVEDSTAALLQNKREIQANIDSCKTALNARDTAEKNTRRIKELKSDETRISSQITELEGHKYLLDQFVVKKVNLMEAGINSHFKYVRFKMFNIQVNGGIDECCDAMVNTNGSYVPFLEANHASKMNAGFDIINTLCTHYGVTAPIFVDFDESVSELIPTNSQVIRLIKPETFLKLDGILRDYLIEKYGGFEAAKRAWNERNKTLRVEAEG